MAKFVLCYRSSIFLSSPSSRELSQSTTIKPKEAAAPHHEVLWLQESSHDIKHCGLANAAVDLPCLIFNRQWCVPSLKEVAAWGGNQGCNQPNKIIVHVPCTKSSSRTRQQQDTTLDM
jgi:hypothetical protein